MEEDIIQRVKSGDKESFRLLYEKYASRIYALALRMTCNVHQAEDLTQEAFIRMWKKIHLFDNKSSFITRGTRVAINIILRHIRKNKYEPDIESANQIMQNKTQTEQDEIIDLENAITQLPKRMKLILILQQGYSHVDIAKMAGISEGTSRALLFKAKQHLKEELQNE